MKKSDRNQIENKPSLKKKKNQCMYSGMANSQPPNQPLCNLVAPIPAPRHNSPRQRLQRAMEMNLKSRPDNSHRPLQQVTLFAPFPPSSGPRCGTSQGTPPSPTAAGSRARDCAGPKPLPLLRAPPGRPLPSVGGARPVPLPPAPTGRALEPFGPFSPAPRCGLTLPGLTSGIREKLEAAEQTHPDQ